MNLKHAREVTIIESTVLKLRSSIFRKFQHKEFSATTPLVINIIADHYRKNNSPITITELADRTNLTPAAISQILNPLESHRVIRRQKTKPDRRHTFVTLTTKGKFILRRINSHHHTEVIDELLEYLGPEDASNFVRLCQRIDDFIENKERISSASPASPTTQPEPQKA